VFVIEPVGERDEFLIPAVVARLVATNEQYCSPPGIECVQDPQRAATMLDAKLAEVPMPRAPDA
jgi:hypothetical protein